MRKMIYGLQNARVIWPSLMHYDRQMHSFFYAHSCFYYVNFHSAGAIVYMRSCSAIINQCETETNLVQDC